MTFNEAEEYRLKNMDVVGEWNEFPPFKIMCLSIAPKNKDFKDRMEVLTKSLYSDMSNEQALLELGFLNENLDVYIIGTDNKMFFEKFLYTYLSEK